jgi:hypothetical protein
MSATQEKTAGSIGTDATATMEPNSRAVKVDPTALAGSKNALGAESVRDGRPATGDDVVEAMDEEGPGVTAALAAEKASI